VRLHTSPCRSTLDPRLQGRTVTVKNEPPNAQEQNGVRRIGPRRLLARSNLGMFSRRWRASCSSPFRPPAHCSRSPSSFPA